MPSPCSIQFEATLYTNNIQLWLLVQHSTEYPKLQTKSYSNLVYKSFHEIMEGIVVGISQISFYQNLSGTASENSVPNFFKKSATIMSDSECLLPTLEEGKNINDQELDETNTDSAWEEFGEDLGSKKKNKTGCTLAERRQMPTRASKESSLLGIKRRTITKPAKRSKIREDFRNLKPSEIKKIYLNKKLTNFKPSSLETIFEEAPTAHSNEEGLNHLMGSRKIKRSLSLSDGFRYSKTLLSKRRAKIKKIFGKRFALKKISLEEFITKLNNSIEKNEDDSNVDCCIDGQKIVMSQVQPNMFQSDTTEKMDNCAKLYSYCSFDSNTISS